MSGWTLFEVRWCAMCPPPLVRTFAVTASPVMRGKSRWSAQWLESDRLLVFRARLNARGEDDAVRRACRGWLDLMAVGRASFEGVTVWEAES